MEPKERAAIRAGLRAAGVTKVTVEYSGSGGEGSVSAVFKFTAKAEKKNKALTGTGTVALEAGQARLLLGATVDEVRNLLDQVLYTEHGGWENGDGAEGTMTWVLRTDKIKIKHSKFYMSEFYMSSLDSVREV